MFGFFFFGEFPKRDMAKKPTPRVPDTYPRYALIVDAYFNTKCVLLSQVEREMAKGMGRLVFAREDAEMYQFVETDIDEGLQSNPKRDEEGD